MPTRVHSSHIVSYTAVSGTNPKVHTLLMYIVGNGARIINRPSGS